MRGTKTRRATSAPGVVPGDAQLTRRLQALPDMAYEDLVAEWLRLYRSQPPKRVSRSLLLLGVAWKLQEAALGELQRATRRRIAEMSVSIETTGSIALPRSTTVRPGARLVREWRGETHEVLVVEAGYEWRGRTWSSLSVIAREITGTRWSGPRFFGLEKAASPAVRTGASGG